MHKILLCFSFLGLISGQLMAQKVSGKLAFEQGKTLMVNIEVKNTFAQQAGGQAIDFTNNGTAEHSYKVTNTTADNTTLHHAVGKLSFDFDGMGQKKSFRSDSKKDIDGPFGKPIKEMLGKTYDLIIDGSGKALMSKPEKIEISAADERAKVIFNLMRDLTSIVYPPKKGEASFFAVLPDGETGIGETWTTSINTANEKSSTLYTLSAVTDTTVVVDFRTNATLLIESEMMGMPTTTNLTSVATGKIILGRETGIIQQKTSVVESTGTTEAMGTSMPMTSKTIITINVTQQD